MASFTSVGDTATLTVPRAGEEVAIALSGTYNMTIALQKEVGAKGSGAYEEIERWSTADATVAYTYYTKEANERLQLIVLVDTSGTCTATITNNATESIRTVYDDVGNVVYEVFENGGFVPTNTPVTTTAALTLTRAKHAFRPVVVNSATGVAITLPEATGSGDEYLVIVGTTVTSGSMTIVAPSSSTSFVGGVGIATDIAGVTVLANVNDDTITMNGSTTGGVKGSYLRFTDFASGVFLVEGFLCSTGVEADPFSAGV